MNEPEIIQQFIDLYNKNAADAEKFDTLKYQYGIASRTIHELKGANALLRENYATLLDENESLRAQLDQSKSIERSRVPRIFNHPNQESIAMGLVLESTQPRYANGKVFRIKFTVNNKYGLITNNRWWSLAPNGEPDSWGEFNYWIENYGPFVEVIDVAD